MSVSNLGGYVDVSAVPWADAVHIYPIKSSTDAHNERRLAALERSGARIYNISVSNAELMPNGIVSRRPVPASLVPKSADECGGLEAYVAVAVMQE